MKYEKLFKDDQKFLEGPYYRKHLNKIWNEETKITTAIPCNDYMQQLSIDTSIGNPNFHFRKKKILLVIAIKTNNLYNEATPKRISQLST